MIVYLFAIFILICVAIVLAYLYSTSELPDIPDWEEFGFENDHMENGG